MRSGSVWLRQTRLGGGGIERLYGTEGAGRLGHVTLLLGGILRSGRIILLRQRKSKGDQKSILHLQISAYLRFFVLFTL